MRNVHVAVAWLEVIVVVDTDTMVIPVQGIGHVVRALNTIQIVLG